MTAAPQVPAFDPESPDAAMLEAYLQMRVLQLSYFECDRLQTWPDNAAANAASDKVAEIENKVTATNTPASTISGVIARLSVLFPQIDGSRWVEEAVVRHGLLGLDWDDLAMDWKARQAGLAAVELVAIEWQQALADYERSVADFNFALTLVSLVDSSDEPEDNNSLIEFYERVSVYATKAEERFNNSRQIRTLIRTLVPDQAAYQRKAEIVMRELQQENAAEWLVRDALFLLGRARRVGLATSEGVA